jgi:cold-inducible RNA-binding protein
MMRFQDKKGVRMNIYVGNLSRDVNEDDLRNAFAPFGEVTSANVIKDRFSGESKGFGFVEMASKPEAQTAIESLNGKELKGRNITVNEARPRTEGGRGGGGGRPGGGGGRPGGGGGRPGGGGRRY